MNIVNFSTYLALLMAADQQAKIVTFEQIREKHWIVKRNKHGVDLVLIRKECVITLI